MSTWLQRLFGGSSSAPPANAPIELLPTASPEDARAWCLAQRRRCRGSEANVIEQIERLRPQLDAWYAAHPIEVRWVAGRDYVGVHDPLQLDSDAMLHGDDPPEPLAWARLLRTFTLVSGGVAFHRGCSADELLRVLRCSGAPTRLRALVLGSALDTGDGEVDRLVDGIASLDSLGGLEHLVIRRIFWFEVRHLQRWMRAPWAASLRTLDLGEIMVDWCDELDEDARHTAMSSLGALRRLTHLGMHNNVGEASDLAVLLAHLSPSVTHLELGSMPADPAWIDALADGVGATGLAEVSCGGGPDRTHPAWDRLRAGPVPVCLYGRRIDAAFPAR